MITHLSIRQVYGVIIVQIPIKGIEGTAGGLLDELDILNGLVDIDEKLPILSEFRAQLRQALGEGMPPNLPP